MLFSDRSTDNQEGLGIKITINILRGGERLVSACLFISKTRSDRSKMHEDAAGRMYEYAVFHFCICPFFAAERKTEMKTKRT